MRNWQRGERNLAKILGCVRVPITGRTRKQAPSDLLSDTLAVEVKTRKRMPLLLASAIDQAESGRDYVKSQDGKDRLAIAVIHKDSTDYLSSLVCMRLSDFLELIKND